MDTGTILQIIGVMLEKMEQDYKTELYLLQQKYEAAMKENEELLAKLRKPARIEENSAFDLPMTTKAEWDKFEAIRNKLSGVK